MTTRDTIIRIGLFLLSSVFAGGVFALSIVADEAKGSDKWRWTAVGTIAAVSVVAVAAFENHRAESARQKTYKAAVKASGDLALAYNQVLMPTTERLRDLSADYAAANPPSTSGTHATQNHYLPILHSLLESAVVLTAEPTPSSYPRARSAYYARDPSTGDFDLVDKYGRTPSPRPKIPGADVAGAHMNTILTGNSPYWADGTPGKVSYLDPAGNRYKAVIAVPVRAGGTLFGVLTVDAPDYDDFTRAHVDLMSTLGNILAASLTLGGP
ncbi:GAF domain-containing protein [Streptomyces hyderabadensis]|uniref:GAF domain-containing protein n=1 Tax=Streptomyces hyderabadensis TaxID=598549 RepID=A0ABP9IJ22_9ACTN|nr:GAF domain-containing protein [Streptomyces hyderabadensis]